MILRAMATFLLLIAVNARIASVEARAVQVNSDDYIESVELGGDTADAHELDTFLPVRQTPLKATTKTPPSARRGELTHAAICAAIFCGAGRECVVENGQPRCACAVHCPLHYSATCGSDGVTYGNACELHRAACMRNIRIHKVSVGPCPEPPTDPLPPQPEEKPLVCYEIERDQLRQLLIDWMKGRVGNTSMHTSGKSYAEVLTDNFRSCDSNGDDELDGMEFVSCVEKNETIADFNGDRPEKGHRLRGLCVDALILMSDANEDWVLDLDEFRRCMDPDFTPPRKQCSLENELYEDGAETRVDCNICVCACGNWVCSAVSCDEVHDYSLFEPYDVEQGPLPSREERYRLLQGFIAAEHVNLGRIEDDVMSPRPPDLQQVANDVTVSSASYGPQNDSNTGSNSDTARDRTATTGRLVTTTNSHPPEARTESSTTVKPPEVAESWSPLDQSRKDRTGGENLDESEADHRSSPTASPTSPWQHVRHVIPTTKESRSEGRIPIISFNITVSEHHVIRTDDQHHHQGAQSDQAPRDDPLQGHRNPHHHHPHRHHHHGDDHHSGRNRKSRSQDRHKTSSLRRLH